jgi:YidC/Oxa1 family membrane protein insertase
MNSDIEKRLLVAFVLCFGLLLLWRAVFSPPAPSPPEIRQPPQSQAPVAPRPRNAPPTAAGPKIVLPLVAGTAVQQIVVENSQYRITLSTQGAVVESWVLRKYQDANNKPLEVVNTAACKQLGYPMSIALADPALTTLANSAIYVAQPASGTLTAPQKVSFTYSNGKVRIRKDFSFGPGYEVQVKVSVFDGQHYLPVAVKWPGDIGDQSLPSSLRDKETLAFYDQGDGIKTVAQKKVDGARLIPGPLTSAGVEDEFFAGVFLPITSQAVFQISRQSWQPPGWTGKQLPQPLTAILGTPAPQPLEFGLSAVPKSLNVLRAENPALESLVHFGLAAFIAKPLLIALQWIYDHVTHNWGWAIVILTVLLNMIFFPLKIKSTRSAQKMQKIAPLMKEIQDRYKQYKFNDPRRQRMTEEIMKLHKEHGTSPFGGCLTMLPQIPIFWGFYEALETSIVFRHAPWVLWIKDLSVPDPLYILPTVSIVASFFMMKMTPMQVADPAQQRMMMFMPIFMGIVFYEFAAGDTLYYVTYNFILIAQQLWINRTAPPVKGPAPPAKGRGQGPAEPPPGSGRRGSGSRRPAVVKG